ncbi:MAG: polysaccharide pyruvyl transferase family protein [Candidatus Gracilibacteria bacterium]
MKHSPNIVICGNYGATNLGDEAILESILQFVHKAVPGAHVTVVSANPSLTASQHHVNVVPKIPSGFRSFFSAFFGKKLRKTLDAYRHADAVIFGGGGLFSDEKPRAIFIWSMQILPALLMKKPVFCFGQSVGPLMMKMSRRMVKFLFRRMKVVIVRDEASRGLLEKIGVRHAVEYVPDPVFGLNIGKNSSLFCRRPGPSCAIFNPPLAPSSGKKLGNPGTVYGLAVGNVSSENFFCPFPVQPGGGFQRDACDCCPAGTPRGCQSFGL